VAQSEAGGGGERKRPAARDVLALRESCERSLTRQWYYEAYESLGVSYAPAHRRLEGVWTRGEGEEQYVIARLRMPESITIWGVRLSEPGNGINGSPTIRC